MPTVIIIYIHFSAHCFGSPVLVPSQHPHSIAFSRNLRYCTPAGEHVEEFSRQRASGKDQTRVKEKAAGRTVLNKSSFHHSLFIISQKHQNVTILDY